MTAPSPEEIAEQRIAAEAQARTGTLDLRDLHLATLPAAVFGLTHLRALLVCDGIRLPRTSLGAGANQLASLRHLEHLALASMDLSDLAPIARLTDLQSLDCSVTRVADLAPVASLTNLQSLDCSDTQVADLAPIASLTNLQSLDCGYTRVADLAPIASLTNLQSLYCSVTRVADLAPIASLTNLQSLDCSDTPVADLAPIASLTNLQSLDCNFTRVANLAPIASLTNLQSLDCSFTRVADLAPIASLPCLKGLNASGCQLGTLPSALWQNSSLQKLILWNSTVSGLPTELLSQGYSENCLPAIRAHFADLALEKLPLTDIRVLLLGNGMVGKTQIANALAGRPFEERWNSTHGIQIGDIDLEKAPPAKLHFWDFGGQDIYHGTHALFLGGPAILALIFALDRENIREYEHDGLKFDNHPLDYWLALLKQQAHPASPLLVIQNKCDQARDERRNMPPEGALEGFPLAIVRSFSAKTGYGRAGLMEAIHACVDHLRARLGQPEIGGGRLRVQRRLEAMRAGEAAPRWIEHDAFDALCDEVGNVTDKRALLTYLDRNGTVFYRPGLFGDRIILDQNWALDAIYTIFRRKDVYRPLQRRSGRFTREDLAGLVWREQSDDERKLLLGMMQRCGMCFAFRRFEDDVEYIAPDLLPAREAVDAELAAAWDAAQPGSEAQYDYAVVHGGLIRTVMAAIGGRAGPSALYWKGGLCGFETTTGSRFRIETEPSEGWAGRLTIRTQRGDADSLLDLLAREVEQAQSQLGMRPLTPSRPRAEPAVTPNFATERQGPRWYVSYAWGDDRTPEGRAREQAVEEHVRRAEARGRTIIRDKNALRRGDRISAFMRDIGAGDRIYLVLSEKYLRSPFCMFELAEIWRNSRHEGAAFLGRVRAYALPDARIFSTEDRVDHAIFWQQKFDALTERTRPPRDPTILGERGFTEYKLMKTYYSEVADMLSLIADQVLPQSFDEIDFED